MTFRIEELCELCREAGKIFSDEGAAEAVTVKGDADFVTEVDMAVQEFMRKEVSKRYPDAVLLSEESDNAGFVPAEWTFILDPVDGTTNLIHHYRQSAVSLGLCHNGRPVAGVVYNPFTDEMFCAEAGKGAFRNGTPIHVSCASDMRRCVITVGTMPYYKEYAVQNFDLFRRIYMDAVDIRRSGSAALDLCYVADGRTDAFFERKLKPWDFAAGAVILTEAGGTFGGFRGEEIDFFAVSDILADNGKIHKKMMEYFQ